MKEYWTKEHHKRLKQVNTFEEIGAIALEVQKAMGDGLSQVCGPISTGGAGNIEKNMDIFSKTIDKLIEKGIKVYTQIPLEEAMHRVKEQLGEAFIGTDLLEGIYRPLFESRRVVSVYFIHGWESSSGARWEHDLLTKQGTEIIYLPKGYVD